MAHSAAQEGVSIPGCDVEPGAGQWLKIEDAPLGVQGHVWSPSTPDRVDAMGEVVAYSDGERFVASSWRGTVFTLWHPLPELPNPAGP